MVNTWTSLTSALATGQLGHPPLFHLVRLVHLELFDPSTEELVLSERGHAL